MPLTVPDLPTLSQSAATAIATRLPGADATPPRSVLGVLAKVWSGGIDGLYGAIQQAADNLIYDTADIDTLVRYAGFWGIVRQPPKSAGGQVIFSGSSTGSPQVDEGAVLTRADGLQFTLGAQVTLEGGTAAGTVTCTSAGSITNTPSGTLTLQSAPAGVSSTVTIGPDGLGGGADLESPDSLLAQLLQRLRETPQGGSDADYRRWALAVPGVTRAWVFPGWQGTGTVGLTFMMDGRPNPVPLGADVAAVQAAIAAARPVAAPLFVFAPTAAPLAFTIHLNPSSAAAQAAVEAALASLIANQCTPGGTYVVGGVPTSGGLLYLSHIRSAIANAGGVDDFTLDSPTANIQAAPGQITTYGGVTWV